MIDKLYSIFLEFPNIVTDSRKAISNSIFFALKGNNFDGNKFAAQAIQNGCKYAVCDDTDIIGSDKYIYVDNVLEALQTLSKIHRKNLNIPIVAITGTNGKTTTKELICNVLKQKFNIGSTIGNLNNHIGVPLTLLQFNKNNRLGVVEMGANHIGEIEKLCNIADPNYGIITNIGTAHIEGFGSFNGVVTAKTELYKYLSNQKGKVFVNSYDSILNKNLIEFEGDIISYGKNNTDYCWAEEILNSFYVKLKLHDSKGKKVYLNSKLYGSYNFSNILAASCIGLYFGLSLEEIKEGIENYIPDNNRSQVIKTKNNTIILDAYNANPSSMKEAINNFTKINSDNKLVIFGDMLELGDVSEQEHMNVINQLVENNLKDVILVGEIFTTVNKEPKFICANSIDEVFNEQMINKYKDYVVLIKGSRGMRLEKALQYFN